MNIYTLTHHTRTHTHTNTHYSAQQKAHSYTQTRTQTLTQVRKDLHSRHKRLVKVQEANGVVVIRGKFTMRHRVCRNCNDRIPLPEEKRTDVNIAVQLLQRAYRDEYDKAIIITGDSDMVPAIVAVRESFPGKKVGVIPPIGRRAEEIEKAAHFKSQMTENDLRDSMLPDPVVMPDGQLLTCPIEWK